VGLLRKVGIGAAASYLAALLAGAWHSAAMAGGIALGGGFALALFLLYRALAGAMLSGLSRRRALTLFWLVWAIKWPALCAALYFAFKTQLAAPVGVALGAGLLPAVALLLVLRALLLDAWYRLMRRQAS
jgi:hypothetical protein